MNGTNRNEYEAAVDFVQQGKHQEAFVAIERYLQTAPTDVEALNDAGAICHCIGKTHEAIKYLSRAHQLEPHNKQVLLNLQEAYIAAQMPDKIEELFDQAQEFKLLNPQLLNRTADLFVQQGNITGAVEVLLRSLNIWPNQEILEHMLTVLKSKRPKIAFFCGADGPTFLNPIIDFLKERFEIRVFQGQNQQQLYELMEWSDISWFEWCTELAQMGTTWQKVCKVVVRLHRYEAYTDWPQKINWHNVDVLITVGNSVVKNFLVAMIPQIVNLTSIVTIPNGVDIDRISFTNKERGKKIAFIGNGRSVKNMPLILQCMQKLRYMDSEYKLYIAGIFQDPVLEQYIRHMTHILGLEGSVICDGWRDDISSWLNDKHYIVSSSLIESQGMGILEGMAAGLKPIIHYFPGADEIYPQEFLFNIAEDFCEQVLSDNYEPLRYRQFVEQRYSRKQQLKDINHLLSELGNQIGIENFKSNKTASMAAG